MNPFAYDDGTLFQSIIAEKDERDLIDEETLAAAHAAKNQKRWSQSTAATTDSSTPFLDSETRKVPFRQTRGPRDLPRIPVTANEGKFRDSYGNVEIELGEAFEGRRLTSDSLPHHASPEEYDEYGSGAIRDGNGNWRHPTEMGVEGYDSRPGSPSKRKNKLRVVNSEVNGSFVSLNPAAQGQGGKKSWGSLRPEGLKVGEDGEGVRLRTVSSEARAAGMV